jgi:hypothetical protein
MIKQNPDRLQLDSQRSLAAQYFCEKYSREERYLQIYSRDCENFLASEKYLLSKDTANQYYFDFLVFFESLNEKMIEFRWSEDFLNENGIDYSELKRLYLAAN